MDAKVARERMKAFTSKKIETAEAELENIFQRIGRTADNGTSFIETFCRWAENYRNPENLGYRVEIRFGDFTRISWNEPDED
jgi:hypothetical protein